jgi:hypothetical protein
MLLRVGTIFFSMPSDGCSADQAKLLAVQYRTAARYLGSTTSYFIAHALPSNSTHTGSPCAVQLDVAEGTLLEHALHISTVIRAAGVAGVLRGSSSSRGISWYIILATYVVTAYVHRCAA